MSSCNCGSGNHFHEHKGITHGNERIHQVFDPNPPAFYGTWNRLYGYSPTSRVSMAQPGIETGLYRNNGSLHCNPCNGNITMLTSIKTHAKISLLIKFNYSNSNCDNIVELTPGKIYTVKFLENGMIKGCTGLVTNIYKINQLNEEQEIYKIRFDCSSNYSNNVIVIKSDQIRELKEYTPYQDEEIAIPKANHNYGTTLAKIITNAIIIDAELDQNKNIIRGTIIDGDLTDARTIDGIITGKNTAGHEIVVRYGQTAGGKITGGTILSGKVRKGTISGGIKESDTYSSNYTNSYNNINNNNNSSDFNNNSGTYDNTGNNGSNSDLNNNSGAYDNTGNNGNNSDLNNNSGTYDNTSSSYNNTSNYTNATIEITDGEIDEITGNIFHATIKGTISDCMISNSSVTDSYTINVDQAVVIEPTIKDGRLVDATLTGSDMITKGGITVGDITTDGITIGGNASGGIAVGYINNEYYNMINGKTTAVNNTPFTDQEIENFITGRGTNTKDGILNTGITGLNTTGRLITQGGVLIGGTVIGGVKMGNAIYGAIIKGGTVSGGVTTGGVTTGGTLIPKPLDGIYNNGTRYNRESDEYIKKHPNMTNDPRYWYSEDLLLMTDRKTQTEFYTNFGTAIMERVKGKINF